MNIFGEYNYNAMKLAPHGNIGWKNVPSMDIYRCHRLVFAKAEYEQVSNIVTFLT